MTAVPLEEAQARLPELLGQLQPGEEITITEQGRPLARLKKVQPTRRPPRRAGNCKGMMVAAADEEHLEDFAEYLE